MTHFKEVYYICQKTLKVYYRVGVLSPTYFWEVTQTYMFMKNKFTHPREFYQNMGR